ncbi:hypothetical protein [Nocardia salmonicida]|uniref:hypothetical protein n=1 Tax=Nocardia salmonicida TaxID=53431 RepID=UPI0033EA2713
MLAKPGRPRQPPGGWCAEMKWDGVRAIAHRTPTGISLWSRNLRERNNAGIMPMGCFVDEGDLVIDAIVNVNGVLDVGLLG